MLSTLELINDGIDLNCVDVSQLLKRKDLGYFNDYKEGSLMNVSSMCIGYWIQPTPSTSLCDLDMCVFQSGTFFSANIPIFAVDSSIKSS